MESHKQPWPVLFLCCVLSFNSSGMAFGMAAIFTDLMDTFSVSRSTASVVQSVCIGLIFLTGIFTGHLHHWQGTRVTVITGNVLVTAGCVIAFLATGIVQVIVGIGVIAGIGLSFTYLTINMALATMFHDSKSLAMVINAISAAVGNAVYPLLYRYLVKEYSLSGTFLILAAINSQMILCGALIGLYAPKAQGKTSMIEEEETDAAIDAAAHEGREENARNSRGGDEDYRSSEENSGNNPTLRYGKNCSCCTCGSSCCRNLPKTSCFQLTILKDKTFVLFTVFGSSAYMFFMHPVMFMADMVRANQLTADDGSFFLTVVYCASLVSRLVAAVLYKPFQSRILFVYSVSIAAGGVVCLFFAFARQYSHFVATSVFLGFTVGIVIIALPLVYLELLGPGRFSIGRGYGGAVEGVFFCIAGPYGGMIRDLTNSYETLFYIAIVQGLLVGSLLFFMSLRFLRRSSRSRTVISK